MTNGRLRAVATALAAVDIVAFAAAVTLLLLTRDSVPAAWRSPDNLTNAIAAVPFAVIGVLIVNRLPRHPVGWMLLVASASIAFDGLALTYAAAAAFARWGLPGAEWSMWLNQWVWIPSFFLPAVLPHVYPDGRLVSRRWSAAVGAVAALALFVFAVEAFGSNEGAFYGFHYRNPVPFQIPVSGMPGSPMVGLLFTAFIVVYAVGIAAFVVRFRRSRSDERQQLKIFLYVLAVLVATQSLQLIATSAEVTVLANVANILSQLALDALPVAIAIAIFRYRLYDIDVVISRTLVYGVLAIFITAVYVAVVVGAGSVAGSHANLALSIAATAIVAVAFQPLRERLQRLANRLVYGRRATPYEVLSQFAHQLVGTPSVDDILPAIAQAAMDATGAKAATTRLHLPSGRDISVSWPAATPGASTIAEPVVADGKTVGALEVHGVTELEPGARGLLQALAKHVALVYRNVGLTLELEDRVRDIGERATAVRASRLRLLNAADDERRRLEAQISSGTTRTLAVVSDALAEASSLACSDPAGAASRLERIGAETTTALDGLRELARGIFPPLLVDQGLVAALSAYARRQPVPATVLSDEPLAATRFGSRLEATAYFCCVAALQHAARLGAHRADIELQHSAGSLRFAITGWGLLERPDPAEAGEIVDRMDAVGGKLALEDVAGGVRLAGEIPIQAEAVAAVQTSVRTSGPNSDFGT